MYLMWRIQTGRSSKIQLNFMLAGHTKFSPDQHFGTFKKLYRRTFVSSLQEIKQVFHHYSPIFLSSSISGHVYILRIWLQVVLDSATNNRAVVIGMEADVKQYDWSAYLPKYYKRVDLILSYQQFIVDKIGTIACRVNVNSNETSVASILKPTVPDPQQLPDLIPAPGLDAQRQWYLFDQIREFCKEECADLVCPKPDIPKPKC